MFGALRVWIWVLDAANHTRRGPEHCFVTMVVFDDVHVHVAQFALTDRVNRYAGNSSKWVVDSCDAPPCNPLCVYLRW